MNLHALEQVALSVRSLSMDAIQKAASGHPGLPLGAAELAAVLYGEVLKHNPANPLWFNRDRFVLSAGHGSMFLYSALYLSGYQITLDDIKNFRQKGSICAGHPEYGLTPGVETTTGPLGQGISTAVGLAIAESMTAGRFNTKNHEIINHYTYALVGEGCLMEGISSEASSLAGHLKLGKLIVFYDENRISIDGSTDITFTENIEKRYDAYGWQVLKGSMYDMQEILSLVEAAKKDSRPSLIMLKSVIGKGASTVQGTSKAHGAPIGKDGVVLAKKELGLNPEEDFFVADEAVEFFKEKQVSWKQEEETWQRNFDDWAKENPGLKATWDEMLCGGLKNADHTIKAQNADSCNFKIPENLPNFNVGDSLATRAASGQILNALADANQFIVGGSADLSSSNITFLKNGGVYSAENPQGRNIYFGIREAAMAAVTNGIQLYGFYRSFCSTFLVFADYLRPALRLSALMKLPAIYVFSHDSIYVGEDGPTHQPIETVTSLRMIPGVKVLRPGDAQETVEAWKIALTTKDCPTCLILTRQAISVYEKADPDWQNTILTGAYIVQKGTDKPDVTVLASGSEVSLAIEASQKTNKNVRIISVIDRELFKSQPQAIKNTLIYNSSEKQATTRVIVAEAGISLGWESFVDSTEDIFCINRFGISAPAKVVAQELGFKAEALSELIEKNEK